MGMEGWRDGNGGVEGAGEAGKDSRDSGENTRLQLREGWSSFVTTEGAQ